MLTVNGVATKTISSFADLADEASRVIIGKYLPLDFDSEQFRNVAGETKPVGCRLSAGNGSPHLWLVKDSSLGNGSELRFAFIWIAD